MQQSDSSDDSFDDVSSIAVDDIIFSNRKALLAVYDSEQVMIKIEECLEFLDGFSKGLKKPNNDIIRGLQNYFTNLMRNVYDTHDDIIFKGETFNKDELFLSYMPA